MPLNRRRVRTKPRSRRERWLPRPVKKQQNEEDEGDGQTQNEDCALPRATQDDLAPARLVGRIDRRRGACPIGVILHD